MRELDSDLKIKFRSNVVKLRVWLIFAVIFAILSLAVFLLVWKYPCFIENFTFPKPTSDYVISLAQVLGAISGILFLYVAFLGQQQQIIIQQQEIRSQNKFNNRTINNQYFFELLNRLTVIKKNLFITRFDHNEKGNHKKEYGDEAFYYYMRVYLMSEFCYIQSDESPKNTRPFIIIKDRSKEGSKLKIDDPEYLKKEDLKFIFDNYEKIWGIESYLKIFEAIITFLVSNKMGDYLPVLEGSLSADESLFLFYRIQVDMGDLTDFLIERRFLAGIDRNFLLHPDNYYLLYPKK